MKTKKSLISIFVVFIVLFGLLGSIGANKASANYTVQTCDSATLNGYVDPNGNPTTAWFEWGPTSSLGYSTTPQTYYSYTNFSSEITGLSENTTYYYEAKFQNSSQGTWSGDLVSFTTSSCNNPINPPPPTQYAPTVNIYASPSSINYGGSSTIYWSSTNASYCILSGGNNNWNGGNQNISGSFSTGALYYNTTYNITCTSSTGQQASSSATVYVNSQNNYYQNVTANIYASPGSISYGGSSTISWYSNNASYCNITGGNNNYLNGNQNTSGSFNTGALYYTTTYTVTCYNNYNNYYNNYYYGNGSASNSVTVYVSNQPVYQPVVYQPTTSLTAVTRLATEVTDTSAQLNSFIDNYGNGGNTNAWFEWGTTIDLGNTTTTTPVGSSASVVHADTLSGLSPGTTYYFRAVAENSYSKSIGDIISFTTTGAQPVAIYHPTSHPSALVLITSSVDRNQAIVPTIDNTRPHPGDEINYTINYQNAGNATVTNLTLQAALPGEVDYISSSPSTPVVSGNTLIFNLGTLRAGDNGIVTIKVQVKDDAVPGTDLDFPATLSYIDPSGQNQTINTNVTAQVWASGASSLGAFVFGSGFFPTNIFGWLLLIILILILILIARYLYNRNGGSPSVIKKTTTTIHQNPITGKKTTTTMVEE